MSFLRKIFGIKDRPIQSKVSFWKWFTQHQLAFFKTVKSQHQIEAKFLNNVQHIRVQLRGFHVTEYFRAEFDD
jgi:hypothetical protein